MVPQKWTDTQTDRRTHGRTFQLIESIALEGQCFEKIGNISVSQNIFLKTNMLNLYRKKILETFFSSKFLLFCRFLNQIRLHETVWRQKKTVCQEFVFVCLKILSLAPLNTLQLILAKCFFFLFLHVNEKMYS